MYEHIQPYNFVYNAEHKFFKMRLSCINYFCNMEIYLFD